LVEHDLAKVGVASSSLVFRSTINADSGGYLHFFSPGTKVFGKEKEKIVSPGWWNW
jgi:hypothetical protein